MSSLPQLFCFLPLPGGVCCGTIDILRLSKAIDSPQRYDVADYDGMQGAVRVINTIGSFLVKRGWTVSPHRTVPSRGHGVCQSDIRAFFGGRATSALLVGVHLTPNTIRGRGQLSVRDRPSPSSICFRFSHRALPGAFVRISVPAPRHLESWSTVRMRCLSSGTSVWSDGRVIDKLASM